MNKPKQISISIPKPCHEDWDKMTPTERGRHCVVCDKVVMDFRSKSDKEIYKLLTSTKGQMCGRFRVSQLNRPIARPDNSFIRDHLAKVAAGMALLTALSSATDAQTTDSLPTQELVVDSLAASTENTILSEGVDSVNTGGDTTLSVRNWPEADSVLTNVILLPFEIETVWMGVIAPSEFPLADLVFVDGWISQGVEVSLGEYTPEVSESELKRRELVQQYLAPEGPTDQLKEQHNARKPQEDPLPKEENKPSVPMVFILPESTRPKRG